MTFALWIPTVFFSLMLFFIAGLHVAWGLGSAWPAKDTDTLAQLVVGTPPGTPMPSPLACHGVGLILSVWGVYVPSALYWRFEGIFLWGVLLIALIFFARGFGGYVFPIFQPRTGPSIGAFWNKALYSPLSLVLSLCAFAVWWSLRAA